MTKIEEHQHKTRLKQLIVQAEDIEAIKYIRELTSMGLKESKELFELFRQDLSKLDTFNFENLNQSDGNSEYINPELDDNDLFIINKYIENDKKLIAIKYISEKLNISLNEAKDIVDEFDEEDIKSEILFTEENEATIVDSKVSDESFISFETLNETPKMKSQKADRFTKQKEDNLKTMTDRRKETMPTTFGKMLDRERNIKRSRSNSGCMIMLTFIFLTVFLIISGIRFL